MRSNDKAWAVTDLLIDYMRGGKTGLQEIPSLIKRVIKDELWKEFYCEPLHQVVRHESFIHYVTDPVPSGLATDIKTLKNLCMDDVGARDAIDAAVQRKAGDWNTHPETSVIFDNVQDNNAPTGNTKDAALRRLRKDRPDLHEKVLADELSANAAMVEAGFRKKKTAEELTIHHFGKCQSRMVPLKAIADQLEPHEAAVLRDWINERIASP